MDQAEQARAVVHEGWLHKLGARVKNWKYRYFVLSEGELTYFRKKGEGEKKLGCIALDAGVTDINIAPANKFKRAHCVEIHAEKRVYVVSAASHADAEKWVECMRDAWQQQQAASNHPHGDSEEDEPLAGLGGMVENDKASPAAPTPSLVDSIQAGDNPLSSTYKLDGKGDERRASDLNQYLDLLQHDPPSQLVARNTNPFHSKPKDGDYARVGGRNDPPPNRAVVRQREGRSAWGKMCGCCVIL